MFKIPFFTPDIGEDEIKEVTSVLKSGWLSTGPKTEEFENKLKRYIGCKHAIAVNSCSAAMHLALAAYGIGKGDEVITTPYTMAATAEVIVRTGARPVFVDIKKDTFNINSVNIEKAITSKTRVVMPVHIAGQPCDMDAVLAVAKKHNLIVIEDAAHALAAKYKNKNIGAIGNATCFSFYATKNLTTGEGGMVTTGDTNLANKIRILSLHGMSEITWKRFTGKSRWYYEILEVGYKYNLSDILAAIGVVQFKKLNEMQEKRKEIVKIYKEELSGVEEIILPSQREGTEHAWHLYIIQIKPELLKITRDEFIERLIEEGVGTSVHFIPLHLMPFYKKCYGFKRGDFPNAEFVYERAISLPLYPKLSKSDAQYVAERAKKIINEFRR